MYIHKKNENIHNSYKTNFKKDTTQIFKDRESSW